MSREPFFSPGVGRGLLAAFFQLVAGLLFLCAAGLFGLQCYGWLLKGEWAAFPLSELLAPITSTGWIGVDKILTWIMGMPATVGLVIAGFVVVFFSVLAEDL